VGDLQVKKTVLLTNEIMSLGLKNVFLGNVYTIVDFEKSYSTSTSTYTLTLN
jgi:hypothetical protein